MEPWQEDEEGQEGQKDEPVLTHVSRSRYQVEKGSGRERIR